MDRRDVWMHRIVAAAIAAVVITIATMHGLLAAAQVLLYSGVPIAVLTGADRKFYGPTKDTPES
jgi:hypothetical protein